MPRLSAETWQIVRAEREAGESFGVLATRYGVNKAAIVRMAGREKWDDGSHLGATIRRKVTEKVTGISPAATIKRKTDAIDARAEEGANIIRTHREEWETHRTKFAVPDDFEMGKMAKISSEMLIIRQKGERAAWGLDDAAAAPTIVIDRSYGK